MPVGGGRSAGPDRAALNPVADARAAGPATNRTNVGTTVRSRVRQDQRRARRRRREDTAISILRSERTTSAITPLSTQEGRRQFAPASPSGPRVVNQGGRWIVDTGEEPERLERPGSSQPPFGRIDVTRRTVIIVAIVAVLAAGGVSVALWHDSRGRSEAISAKSVPHHTRASRGTPAAGAVRSPRQPSARVATEPAVIPPPSSTTAPLPAATPVSAPPVAVTTPPPAPPPSTASPPSTSPPSPPTTVNPIPQGDGGDHDADNNGGPIDGDGDV